MTRWIAVALLLGAVSPSHGADSARATMDVGAFVAPRLVLTAVDQPQALELDAADVARGYVDVAASYSIRTNDRNGYLLRFAPRQGYTTGVEISGAGLQVAMVDAEVEVVRTEVAAASRVALRYRLHLSPAAVPGRYPLPVHVSVAPL